MGLAYPEKMTPELEEVLQMLSFHTAPLAGVYRDAGQEIPRKIEAEQAFILHKCILLVLEHGAGWREAFRLNFADAVKKGEL